MKDVPLQETLERWYNKCKFIPDHNVPMIVDEIEKMATLPRNIPNVLIALYNKKIPAKEKAYDIIDDPNYPIDYLWNALNILRTEGVEAFDKYCEAVSMPRNDRDRVKSKHSVAYTYADVKKIVSAI